MKNKRGSLYGTMLVMVVLPMIIVTAAATALCANYYLNTIAGEVREELKSICALTGTAMDEFYPGDYLLVGDAEKAILKGDTILNGNFRVPDTIKQDTGTEVSIFYYDTRILTTLVDENGDRIVGTGANAAVMRDVYEGGQPAFYKDVNITGRGYYAYYTPLINADGTVAGMIGAGRASDLVINSSLTQLWPLIAIIIFLMVAETLICMYWTGNTIKHISIIESFLRVMSEGRFTRELSPVITSRDDELGRLGASIVQVQNSIRNLIERDMLTGLHNRRFGFARLEEAQRMANDGGVPFCVVMCDIDHFKHFNDTYGHDAGDMVLKEVAKVLHQHMAGKGFAARWGGEEFLLVYTRHNMEEARPMVEAILLAIRNTEVHYMEEELHVTMSFGMANGHPKLPVDNFLKEADDRLYYAKEHGRNQVVVMIPWWTEAEVRPHRGGADGSGSGAPSSSEASEVSNRTGDPEAHTADTGAETAMAAQTPEASESAPETSGEATEQRKSNTRSGKRGRPRKIKPSEREG